MAIDANPRILPALTFCDAPRCHFLWLQLGLRQRHAHHAALGGAVGRRQSGAATVLAARILIQVTFFIILVGFKPL